MIATIERDEFLARTICVCFFPLYATLWALSGPARSERIPRIQRQRHTFRHAVSAKFVVRRWQQIDPNAIKPIGFVPPRIAANWVTRVRHIMAAVAVINSCASEIATSRRAYAERCNVDVLSVGCVALGQQNR